MTVDERAFLLRARSRFLWAIVAQLAGLPVLLVWLYAFGAPSRSVIALFIVAGLVPSIVVWKKIESVRCPRCSGAYFGKLGWFKRPRPECRQGCGLSMRDL